jgi:hypothetical protein
MSGRAFQTKSQKSRDHKSREDKQRRLCRQRDGHECRLEVYRKGKWHECGTSGVCDTVHIYRRDDCGDVWDDPLVVLNGCRLHHDIYDGKILPEHRAYEPVRVPVLREAAAWRFLNRSHERFDTPKYLPVRRKPSLEKTAS